MKKFLILIATMSLGGCLFEPQPHGRVYHVGCEPTIIDSLGHVGQECVILDTTKY